jgi:hypothetical protein
MGNGQTALYDAIEAALKSNAPLVAMLGGESRIIRVSVEDDPELPCVSFGLPTEPSKSPDGEEHSITLHVWSRDGGHREAHLISGAVLQALIDAPLKPAGHHLANLRFVVAYIRREADGRTYHGIVRLRAVLETEHG